MLPKIIVLFISSILVILSFSPLNMIRCYLLFRPLLQPFANNHITFFGIIPINTPLPLIIIFYSFLRIIFKKDFSFKVPNIIPLFLWLYWSIFSLFNTKYYSISIGFIFKILTAISVYIFVYNAVNSVDDIKKLIKTICFSCLLLITYAFYQLVAKQGKVYFFNIVRVKSTLVGANEFGIFLYLCLVATLLLVFLSTDVEKIFYKILLGLIIITSIFALNRGSWIAMSIALFFGYLFFNKNIKIGQILIPMITCLIIFFPIIIQRFSELSEVKPGSNTFISRINIWKTVLKLIPHHPFFGYGIGTTPMLIKDLFGIMAWPHNDYLRNFLEIGIGFIFYIYFLFSTLFLFIKNRYKNWKIHFCYVVLCFYWIIISFPQNIINDVINFPLFMALIACGMKLITIKEA